jgi:hypothetical protein
MDDDKTFDMSAAPEEDDSTGGAGTPGMPGGAGDSDDDMASAEPSPSATPDEEEVV